MNRSLAFFAAVALVSVWANISPSDPSVAYAQPTPQRTIDNVDDFVDRKQRVGRFIGSVTAEDLPDGRHRKLIADFSYVDLFGVKWTAPAGLIYDGASIPQPLWSFGLSPFTGKYRNAAVIHDQYCDHRERTAHDTHLVFYEMMRALGVNQLQARLMYWAVDTFGPHWRTIKATKFSTRSFAKDFAKEGDTLLQSCTANFDQDALAEILKSGEAGTITEEEGKKRIAELASKSMKSCVVVNERNGNRQSEANTQLLDR